MINLFLQIFANTRFVDVLVSVFRRFNILYSGLDLKFFGKLSFFVGVVLVISVGLFLINDKIFETYTSKHVKKHHLTITNHGNVPSIFLFRTIDLPKQLAIRFRVDGNPMIWVSQKDKNEPEPGQEKKKSASAEQTAAPVPGKRNSAAPTPLVPDLDKPFAAAETITKTAGSVSRKTGLFAGIINSITNLLPFKSKALNQAGEELKGFQQDTNDAVKSMNTKIGNVDTLGNQVNSLFKQGSSPLQPVAESGGGISALENTASGAGVTEQVLRNADADTTVRLKNFVYDEDVWHRNIGKVDENGGSLNYAQSKILEPGESMKIDLEVMNLSEDPAPVSLLYKIEVLQIPQINLQMAAPKQYISGVVIYPKQTEVTRLVPAALMTLLILISVQLLVLLSHLLF